MKALLHEWGQTEVGTDRDYSNRKTRCLIEGDGIFACGEDKNVGLQLRHDFGRAEAGT